MAIKRCRCGYSQTTQPHRSASVTAYTCDYCLGLKQRPRSHNVHIEVSSFVFAEKKEVFECSPRKKRA